MTSISQKYMIKLQNIINNYLKDNLFVNIYDINPTIGVFNYINLSSNIDETINEAARKILTSYFESLDESFKNSQGRKERYHIKDSYDRSILTIFGEITYYKTVYKSTLNGSSYSPVDRVMGLKKYDYYDPFIKALVLEYATNNSYNKTAQYINNIIANRFKLGNNSKYLMTRQTVHNIVKQAKIEQNIVENIENMKDVETLYVMADEHFVGSQDKDKDYMVKQVVVFEDIEITKRKTTRKVRRRKNNIPLMPRRKILNKHVISVVDSSIHKETLDYIFNNYDIDKIKNIIVMGDGAGWIKTLKEELKFDKSVDVTFGLDKYHFKQALHRIFLNKELEVIAEEYLINNHKDDFLEIVDEIIKSSPHREETIINNRDYIIKHLKSIIYLYDKKLSCPMESQISHNVASRLTSRPCGFSKDNINQILKLKTMSVNNQNITLAYLNNLNPKKSKGIRIHSDNISYSNDYLKRKEQKILNAYSRIDSNIQFI